ncbi:hypothetical protein EC973_004822, partial [Apophysomyces ossiformis]
RYNYDVARAADYVFSGNADDSDDDDQSLQTLAQGMGLKPEVDWSSWDLPSNLPIEKEPDRASIQSTRGSMGSAKEDDAETSKRYLVKDYSNANTYVPKQESANWSIVPFVPSEKKLKEDESNSLFTKSSLTWWTDPEDPSRRRAIDGLNYWKGAGEPVSGYIFDGKASSDVSEDGYEDIEANLTPVPRAVQALLEMQKLFAFMGETRRLYGSSSHVVRALKSNLREPGNEFGDMSFDGFLEMLMSCLAEADCYSKKNSADDQQLPNFRECYYLYNILNSVYYTLGTTRYLRSFHECLDPLIYESYENEDDDSCDSTVSDDSAAESGRYKLITFKRVPPILIISLEKRDEQWAVYGTESDKGYVADDTIYLDRYLEENKELALKCYRQIDQWQKEIKQARLELSQLQSVHDKSKLNKQEILKGAISFLEKRSEESMDDESTLEPLQSAQRVISQLHDDIEGRLAELRQLESNRQNAMRNLFQVPEMLKRPYDLCATLHHDGMSGTGHYWAYIRVDTCKDTPSEVPSEEKWYRFCDASVTPVTTIEVFLEPVAPFAVIYVDRNIPKYTETQLHDCTSEALQYFVNQDNEDLDREVEAYNMADNVTDNFEKINLPPSSDGASVVLEDDDDFSVGTAIGPTGEVITEQQRYSYAGTMFTKLKDAVDVRLQTAHKYPGDDYRFIRHLDMFIAKANNPHALEQLLLLCMDESDFVRELDEEAEEDESSKFEEAWNHPELQTICQEYDSFKGLSETVTVALASFACEDYQKALQYLISVKRSEWLWRTRIMFDGNLSGAYPGLEHLSFSRLVEKFGRTCIQCLSAAAYRKAKEPAYRTRALEEAIKVAHCAHAIIGPDKISTDTAFNRMRESWLELLEDTSFSDEQQQLLNTLVMTFLEDQDANNEPYPEVSMTNSSLSGEDAVLIKPLWWRYRDARAKAEVHWISIQETLE